MKRMNGLRNNYSPEFKANIVWEILREEKSVAQIAAEHGIHPHQLYDVLGSAGASTRRTFRSEQ